MSAPVCPDCFGVGELAPLATCPRCRGCGSVPAPTATEAIDLIRGALLMLADDAAGRVSKAAVLAAVAKVRREVAS